MPGFSPIKHEEVTLEVATRDVVAHLRAADLADPAERAQLSDWLEDHAPGRVAEIELLRGPEKVRAWRHPREGWRVAHGRTVARIRLVASGGLESCWSIVTTVGGEWVHHWNHMPPQVGDVLPPDESATDMCGTRSFRSFRALRREWDQAVEALRDIDALEAAEAFAREMADYLRY